MHIFTLKRQTEGRGWGLKAREDIPKGALVQEYIGEVVTKEDFNLRTSRKDDDNVVVEVVEVVVEVEVVEGVVVEG
eukprot:762553-Hanusia_phi.AAC.1